MNRFPLACRLAIADAALLTVALITLPSSALAWTAPTANPPGNNVASPINTGATSQLKNGTLGVNALGVFGDSILSGSGGQYTYLNFGATPGSGGYGIRNNNGTLEFRNSSDGSWSSINVTLTNLMQVNGITSNGLGQVTSIKFGDGTTQSTAAGASPWSTNGASIYYNGGNVGIGVSGPTTLLQVGGAVTATTFSGSGASLTNLNANNLTSGTVPAARLGSGSANSTTYLRGDGTWSSPASLAASAKAWVTYNVNGTIEAQYNVSSVTHWATGRWQVFFTNPMPDLYYAVFPACANAGDGAGNQTVVDNWGVTGKATNYVRVANWVGSTGYDCQEMYVIVYSN